MFGFAGDQVIAGRRIGSAALVADGLHARTDALTSLAVLLGAGGVALGWRWADPIVGLAIAAMIMHRLGHALPHLASATVHLDAGHTQHAHLGALVERGA